MPRSRSMPLWYPPAAFAVVAGAYLGFHGDLLYTLLIAVLAALPALQQILNRSITTIPRLVLFLLFLAACGVFLTSNRMWLHDRSESIDFCPMPRIYHARHRHHHMVDISRLPLYSDTRRWPDRLTIHRCW